MKDKIILTGIEVWTHHGCTEEEQKNGQLIKIDLELYLNLSKAGHTDDIDETVDYAKIMFHVKQIAGAKSRKLIETVAEEIAENILNEYKKIDALKVILHKPDAPLLIKYSDVAIEIFRSRE